MRLLKHAVVDVFDNENSVQDALLSISSLPAEVTQTSRTHNKNIGTTGVVYCCFYLYICLLAFLSLNSFISSLIYPFNSVLFFCSFCILLIFTYLYVCVLIGIVLIVLCVLIIVFALVVLFCLWRRNRQAKVHVCSCFYIVVFFFSPFDGFCFLFLLFFWTRYI